LSIPEDGHSFARQGFEVADSEVFLAELDVVDAGLGSFADFGEQLSAARELISGERGAVGDVVEEGRHK